jgi:hypothetical protein
MYFTVHNVLIVHICTFSREKISSDLGSFEFKKIMVVFLNILNSKQILPIKISHQVMVTPKLSGWNNPIGLQSCLDKVVHLLVCSCDVTS